VTEPWGVAQFAALLMGAASSALPWIAAGVLAGLVAFAVSLGLRKAFGAIHTVTYDPWDGVTPIASDYENHDNDQGPDYSDRYDEFREGRDY